jgi:predicted lysophospholipase L1 biosynthesis ABC-type transport system permease subunit
VLLAASAVADLAAASILNADVISAMSEAALDLLTQDKVIVATRSAPTWWRRSSRNWSTSSPRSAA